MNTRFAVRASAVLAVGLLAGPASATNGSPGATGDYWSAPRPSGPFAGKTSGFTVKFGPCVKGMRTVWMESGGSIVGETITQFITVQGQGQSQSVSCANRGPQSAVFAMTVTSVTQNADGSSTTTTYSAAAGVVWFEEAGSAPVTLNSIVGGTLFIGAHVLVGLGATQDDFFMSGVEQTTPQPSPPKEKKP